MREAAINMEIVKEEFELSFYHQPHNFHDIQRGYPSSTKPVPFDIKRLF
jgi:hypothetical protein